MVDFSVAGPIIGLLAGIDVILHSYLDLQKIKVKDKFRFREPSTSIPGLAMGAVVLSTLLSFLLVFIIPLSWILNIEFFQLSILLPLFSFPDVIWLSGLVFLIFGILLHSWSRYVRQEMAASWVMSEEHKLITTGPYSYVRHPSYTSYIFCFIGLILILPSLVTMITLTGIWGYYVVSKVEEKHLIQHFGEIYSEYMKRTGRFLPKIMG